MYAYCVMQQNLYLFLIIVIRKSSTLVTKSKAYNIYVYVGMTNSLVTS